MEPDIQGEQCLCSLIPYSALVHRALAAMLYISCSINGSLSLAQGDLNDLCYLRVGKWQKLHIYSDIPLDIISTTRVKTNNHNIILNSYTMMEWNSVLPLIYENLHAVANSCKQSQIGQICQ